MRSGRHVLPSHARGRCCRTPVSVPDTRSRQCLLRYAQRVEPIVEIRGARALGRNHGRAERRLRGARVPKRRTVRSALRPAQNLTADDMLGSTADASATPKRVSASNARYASVRRSPLLGRTPMPRHARSVTFEHLTKERSRSEIAFLRTTRAYGFSTRASPRSSCRTAMSTPSRRSTGSRSADHDRHAVLGGDRLVFVRTHDGAHVSGPEAGIRADSPASED